MRNSLKFNFGILLIAMSLVPGAAFAGGPNIRIPEGNPSKGNRNAVIAGTAVVGAATAGTLTALKLAGVSLGVAAFSATAAVTAGASVLAAGLAGLIGWGAYKLYKNKIRTKLMGLTSLERKKMADYIARTSNDFHDLKRLERARLQENLDKICQTSNASTAFKANMDLVDLKTVERGKDFFSRLKGSRSLKAYTGNGQEARSYRYYKGFKHQIITELECVDTTQDKVLTDDHFSSLLASLPALPQAGQQQSPLVALSAVPAISQAQVKAQAQAKTASRSLLNPRMQQVMFDDQGNAASAL